MSDQYTAKEDVLEVITDRVKDYYEYDLGMEGLELKTIVNHVVGMVMYEVIREVGYNSILTEGLHCIIDNILGRE